MKKQENSALFSISDYLKKRSIFCKYLGLDVFIQCPS